MCSAIEPWVLQTWRNSITHTSHPSALTEHHRAPGSPGAESLPIVPITSSDTEWICGRTEVLSHRSRQHRTGGRLACAPCAPACAGLLTQAPRLLVCTSESGAHSDGSCWEDGAGTSQPAPSLNPLVLFTPQTACTSLAHAGLAPAQVPVSPFHHHTCSLGMQLGHSSTGVFHFHTLLFLLISPSHQSGTDHSFPVLSLQHWGGIGGDLQFLVPTAFITPSPFLRKEISHEPQWKSQRSTKGVEFRV